MGQLTLLDVINKYGDSGKLKQVMIYDVLIYDDDVVEDCLYYFNAKSNIKPQITMIEIPHTIAPRHYNCLVISIDISKAFLFNNGEGRSAKQVVSVLVELDDMHMTKLNESYPDAVFNADASRINNCFFDTVTQTLHVIDFISQSLLNGIGKRFEDIAV